MILKKEKRVVEKSVGLLVYGPALSHVSVKLPTFEVTVNADGASIAVSALVSATIVIA